MTLTKLKSKNNISILILIVLIYIVLTIVCLNNCYFWDNIQQISKEAHWFYLTDFNSLLIPVNSGAEIVATGYHPPLMGIMTATLWKVFGYHLWVSHVFALMWAFILIFNVWKIIRLLFPDNFIGWIMPVILLESTLLTQFAIGSPDFILFTAFVISLRAILERKPMLLTIGIFFLCCINMRGIFAGATLLIVLFYFNYLQKKENQDHRSVLKIMIPFLPTLILLSAYFIYYFIGHGWFFSGSTSSGHYSIPTGVGQIIKHVAEFGLRSIENGRIIIWFLGIYIAYLTYKSKTLLTQIEKVLLLFFLLLSGLYIIFILITQMPFSARYFMPQFFILSIMTLLGVLKFFNKNSVKFIFILIICFELTGNLWIYPDRIAKSWDCTLAHLPYYELRKDCFKFIEAEEIDYKDISGGFCFYGNSRFIDLTQNDKTIGIDSNRKYYIYSNISNVEDRFVKELQNKNAWLPIKTFEKGFVNITIYKKNSLNHNRNQFQNH